jgi:hypothetical protein
VAAIRAVEIRFGGTFTTALGDSSSPEFRAQADLVIAQVLEKPLVFMMYYVTTEVSGLLCSMISAGQRLS